MSFTGGVCLVYEFEEESTRESLENQAIAVQCESILAYRASAGYF